MRTRRQVRWSHTVAVGAIACALAAAPGALAAPPVISGSDGQVWNTVPEYTVTGDEGTRLSWTGSILLWGGSADTNTATVRFPENIRDGNHFLIVGARPSPGGPDYATRTFVVDRTPPGPLAVSGPPTITAGHPAAFGWSGGEAGARFVWRVEGPTGPIQSAETTSPIASPAPLQPGSYTLVVRQVDAAGNQGPEAAAAFSVVAAPPPPAAPAPAPPAPLTSGLLPLPVGPAQVTIKLPSANAGKLRPRRAATVRTLRPVLRWKRGPRGTKLYNVQIFQVDTSRVATSASVSLRKLRSVFPKTNRLRTPRLRRGACYVWRVWPYRTDDFTKRPLGVSNFCVATARPRR